MADHHAFSDDMMEASIQDAVAKNNRAIIRSCLRNGARFWKEEQGRSITFFCLGHSAHELLRYAIFCGSPMDPDNSGWAPLHEVASTGNIQAAEILLRNGADINALDEGKMTPLHAAVCWFQEGAVRYLLEQGADTEIANTIGSTPMISATCSINNHAIIELLLQFNASVDVRYVGGITTVRDHIRKGNDEALKALLKKYAPPKKRKR